MASKTGTPVSIRLVIDNPVPGVLHSLQDDDKPLDPKRSAAGEALVFECAIRIAPGPRFLGPQVRREGKERRFVYVRVGASAGDHASPWNRRMKIDIHDIDPALLDRAVAGATLIARVNGTGRDGTPACATVKPVLWSV